MRPPLVIDEADVVGLLLALKFQRLVRRLPADQAAALIRRVFKLVSEMK